MYYFKRYRFDLGSAFPNQTHTEWRWGGLTLDQLEHYTWTTAHSDGRRFVTMVPSKLEVVIFLQGWLLHVFPLALHSFRRASVPNGLLWDNKFRVSKSHWGEDDSES